MPQPESPDIQLTVSRFFTSRGINPGAMMLIAFSGGADSTALLAACMAAGYRCRALHCNFQLRGQESMRDETFARQTASRLGCEIEVIRFDVNARRAETGESVEMACRELRYRWFAEMYQQSVDKGESPAGVAIAHHESDNVETFFLNAMRGSGLKGLGAIPAKRNIYLRPLLHTSRQEIISYLSAIGLDYVVDSSNNSNIYSRNKVRNMVLPVLTEAFPNAIEGITHTIGNLRNDYHLLNWLVTDLKNKVTTPDGAIDLTKIAAAPTAPTLLYHILNGIMPIETVEAILKAHANGESGRTFHGRMSTIMLLDRGHLIPYTQSMPLPPVITAEILPASQFSPRRCNSEIWLSGEAANTSPSEWELRPWRHADRMKPFGMKGSRLISDILSDAKTPANEKPNRWVLAFRGEIVWLIGVRASRIFQVTDASERVIKLTVETGGN